jgi:hypothetical protein
MSIMEMQVWIAESAIVSSGDGFPTGRDSEGIDYCQTRLREQAAMPKCLDFAKP